MLLALLVDVVARLNLLNAYLLTLSLSMVASSSSEVDVSDLGAVGSDWSERIPKGERQVAEQRNTRGEQNAGESPFKKDSLVAEARQSCASADNPIRLTTSLIFNSFLCNILPQAQGCFCI